jgi:hypothetical protein
MPTAIARSPRGFTIQVEVPVVAVTEPVTKPMRWSSLQGFRHSGRGCLGRLLQWRLQNWTVQAGHISDDDGLIAIYLSFP